jgi:hypothetical protein
MATYANNTTLKVNRAISGATTVNANCYAEVTYSPSAYGSNPAPANTYAAALPPITKIYGPGQSITLTFTSVIALSWIGFGPAQTTTVTYSLQSGVEFINSVP